jgi:zinc protease
MPRFKSDFARSFDRSPEDDLRVSAFTASLAALPFLASPSRAALKDAPRGAVAKAPAGLAEGVLKKVLPNGLTVLIKPVHSAPVVAVNAWVRVGSVNERDDERGITHFIEHMLFKGTAKLRVGELDRLIKAAGGYNNAHTRYESTDFIDVLPSDKLAVAVGSMAEALQHSTFDAGELNRERVVVLEELHRAQDNPGFETWNKLTNLAFTKHPYQYPIIGYKERLKTMDRQLLVDYWKRWYKPQNIIVVVVGDVDAKAALAMVTKSFGPWARTKDIPGKVAKEPAQTALRSAEFTGDIETTMAVLGVPTCAEMDADTPAVDMAMAILGQGLSSRLNLEVREKQKLGHSLAAGHFNGGYPGLAYLWAELEAPQVQPVMEAVWREVERMKQEPVAPEELERQRLRLESEDASERMSMEGLAGRLGYYEALAGDYSQVDAATQRMRAVTAADIQRVMKKYFQVERATIVVQRPEKSKPTGLDAKAWTKVLSAVTVPAVPALAKAESLPGGISGYALSSGGRLLVKPVHHTPLVAAQISFKSGQLLEPAAKAGGLNLLARTLLKGTPSLDASGFAQAMDDLGVGIGPQADADRFSIGFQSLSSKTDASFALLGKAVRDAEVPEAEFAKEKDRELKDIKDKTDSPDDYASDLYSATFFGKQPYGRPLEGDAKTVKALTRDDVLKLKAQALRPDQLLIVIVGDIEPEAARALVEREFGAKAWGAEGPAPALVVPVAPVAQARRVVEKLNKKQAHLFMGWPAPVPSSKDYVALRLVNSVLGEGMDSRLFTEVREKRSLCYTVNSSFDRRLYPGSWRVYVGTQPERVAEAEQVCLQVVSDVAANGITQEELTRAKAYAKGIFQVARQDFGTEARVLSNYEFWGLGVGEIDRFAKNVDAVTLEDCKRVASTYLQPAKTTVVLVRP